MYDRGGIFCLAPCIIDGTDVGHTWTRYFPEFRTIKYGSTISFYSEIRRYGDLSSKSGVSWSDISFFRAKGGDNTPLYLVQAKINGIGYSGDYLKKEGLPAEEAEIVFLREYGSISETIRLEFDPEKKGAADFRCITFTNTPDGRKLSYSPYSEELVIDSKYTVHTDLYTQKNIDRLVLFEWLTKLEDWKFWAFATHKV